MIESSGSSPRTSDVARALDAPWRLDGGPEQRAVFPFPGPCDDCDREIFLRATPTAAGPSSSKRSVLWRTRGFAALGFDCCVVVGAVSGMFGACFV